MADGPYYVVTNMLDATDVVITVEHADSDYPKANLNNQRASKPYKSDTAFSADGIQTITIDVGAGNLIAPTFLGLMNHNLLEASHDVGVISKATTFVGDDGDIIRASAADEVRVTDMYLTWDAPTARRYWRVSMSGSDAVVPKIGELILGTQVQLEEAIDDGPTWSKVFNNISHETIGGHVWNYRINSYRELTIRFSDLLEAGKDELETLFAATAGSNLPFVFVPEPGDPTAAIARRVYYMRLSDRFVYIDEWNKQIQNILLTEQPRERAS